MSIDVIGFTMGCPSGMSNAYGGVEIFEINQMIFQFGNLTLLLVNAQAFLVQEGYAGTVIAPVFQSFKSFDDDGQSFLLAYISYNSAHK